MEMKYSRMPGIYQVTALFTPAVLESYMTRPYCCRILVNTRCSLYEPAEIDRGECRSHREAAEFRRLFTLLTLGELM